MSLIHYIIRRLILMILVLLGVSLLIFTVMMLLPPGMRVSAYVRRERITPAQIESMINKYGLNDPAPIQYFRWLRNIVSGEFGFSVTSDAPVLEGFRQYFPITLELVLCTTPLIILFGIFLGTTGAVNKDKFVDHGTRVLAIIGYSLPTFWLGLLLLMAFYGLLGIFPPGSLSNENKEVLFSPEFKRITHLLTIDARKRIGLWMARAALQLDVAAIMFNALSLVRFTLLSTFLWMFSMRILIPE